MKPYPDFTLEHDADGICFALFIIGLASFITGFVLLLIAVPNHHTTLIISLAAFLPAALILTTFLLIGLIALTKFLCRDVADDIRTIKRKRAYYLKQQQQDSTSYTTAETNPTDLWRHVPPLPRKENKR